MDCEGRSIGFGPKRLLNHCWLMKAGSLLESNSRAPHDQVVATLTSTAMELSEGRMRQNFAPIDRLRGKIGKSAADPIPFKNDRRFI